MTAKRANGEGSIYKEGEKWTAAVSYRDANGRRRRKTHTSDRRGEVSRWLSETLRQLEQGTLITTSRQSTSDFLRQWLEDVAQLRVRPTTYRTYAVHLQRLTPAFEGIKLQKLKSFHIQRAYREMEARGLAPSTIRQSHAVLSRALGYAVRQGLLANNPAGASKVTLPRVPNEEMQYLDEAQTVRLLDALRDDEQLYPLIYLLVSTGLRIGEALGLRWRDVDGSSLSIRVQLQHIGGVPQLVELKTKASRRTLKLLPSVSRALARWRAVQGQMQLAAGPAWLNTQRLVFTDDHGRPLRRDVMSARFHRVLRQNRLPYIRLHDLRHTYAVLELLQGTDLKTLQRRLGHAKAATTMEVYAHVVPSMEDAAIERMEQLLGTSSAEEDGIDTSRGG